MVLANASGRFSSTTTKVAEFTAAHTPRPFSESIVACGMMAHRRCGVGPRFEGLEAQVPTEDGAGCVCRPCLMWWWRLWVAVAVTAEMTYQVSADQLAVVEAAGKYAAHVGLLDDCAIASFKEIAAGLISRARGTEVFSGCLDVERERRARAVRPARCAPAAGIGTSSTSTARSSREPARVRSAGRPGPSRAARACWDRS